MKLLARLTHSETLMEGTLLFGSVLFRFLTMGIFFVAFSKCILQVASCLGLVLPFNEREIFCWLLLIYFAGFQFRHYLAVSLSEAKDDIVKEVKKGSLPNLFIKDSLSKEVKEANPPGNESSLMETGGKKMLKGAFHDLLNSGILLLSAYAFVPLTVWVYDCLSRMLLSIS